MYLNGNFNHNVRGHIFFEKKKNLRLNMYQHMRIQPNLQFGFLPLLTYSIRMGLYKILFRKRLIPVRQEGEQQQKGRRPSTSSGYNFKIPAVKHNIIIFKILLQKIIYKNSIELFLKKSS